MPVAESLEPTAPDVDVSRQRAPTHKIFRYESNRLLTFRLWPEADTGISGQRLARAGFYYSGDKTTVQCFECAGSITEWSAADIPLTKHRLQYPNCRFIRGLSDNIPLVNGTSSSATLQSILNNHLSLPALSSSDDSGHSSDNSPLSSSPDMTSTTGSSSSPQSSSNESEDNLRNDWNRDRNISAFRESMKSEANRLKTFSINGQSLWKVPLVSPEDLARAGFYYICDDKVQCAFCTGFISNWSPGLRPLGEHAKHFPLCPFIMEEDVGNIPIGSDPIRDPLPVLGHDVCGSGITPTEQMAAEVVSTRSRTSPVQEPIDMRQLGIQPYSGPKRPDMGPLESRQKSFHNTGWDNTIPISTDKLAEAGFYYIGYADAVKCFHCDGGLTEWTAGDDPWVEHAKKFPNCNFLKLNKSHAFIEECRQMEQTSNGQTDDQSGSDDTNVCRVVDQWMNTEVVQQLVSLELYSTDLIKAALNDRYYSCRQPYDSFAQLYEAVSNLWDSRPSSRQSFEMSNNIQLNISPTLPTQQSNTEQTPINPIASLSSITSPSTTSTATAPVPQSPNTSTATALVGGKPTNTSSAPNGTEQRLVCKICLIAEIAVVFLPCGHQLACSDCAQRLTDCPVCRQPIRGYVRTFFS